MIRTLETVNSGDIADNNRNIKGIENWSGSTLNVKPAWKLQQFWWKPALAGTKLTSGVAVSTCFNRQYTSTAAALVVDVENPEIVDYFCSVPYGCFFPLFTTVEFLSIFLLFLLHNFGLQFSSSYVEFASPEPVIVNPQLNDSRCLLGRHSVCIGWSYMHPSMNMYHGHCS